MIKNPPQFARLSALSALAVFACTTTGPAGTASSGSAQSAFATAEPNPPAFVEAACGDCHSVEPAFLSPNPNAPSFESIANREGLTDDTLSSWLADAHNYPELMDFDLNADQIDVVADYMITLRRAEYGPEQ